MGRGRVQGLRQALRGRAAPPAAHPPPCAPAQRPPAPPAARGAKPTPGCAQTEAFLGVGSGKVRAGPQCSSPWGRAGRSRALLEWSGWWGWKGTDPMHLRLLLGQPYTSPCLHKGRFLPAPGLFLDHAETLCCVLEAGCDQPPSRDDQITHNKKDAPYPICIKRLWGMASGCHCTQCWSAAWFLQGQRGSSSTQANKSHTYCIKHPSLHKPISSETMPDFGK